MRSIAFLATALLAAAFATPLDGGLIGLPGPDSIVPAPAFSADTFLTPAEQFLNSGQPPNSGNQIFPATDSDAVTEAKLDISDGPDKQGVQVASAAASPSDENVKSLDASNTDQPTFSTSLNLPANLLKTDFTVSASLPEDVSNLETACIDSSTESAPKLRTLAPGILHNKNQHHQPTPSHHFYPDLRFQEAQDPSRVHSPAKPHPVDPMILMVRLGSGVTPY
ncbi:hypothetical protein MMC22_003984 [Lobaria immixta]|nr:hypothetical protein [Lobaria immixta]